MTRFDGHVAWITGGGSGIGAALALELAAQGCDVAVSGRREEKLTEVVREIEARGRRGLAVTCDVTEEASVDAAVASVVETFGKLDVAIANAGFSVAGRFEKLSVDDWKRQYDVNVFGAIATCKAALPHVRETRGRLVLVGSVSAMLATPGMGAYTSSKYAIRAIGQTLAMELHGSGVSCTTLHPGFVESEIAQVDNRGRHHPERQDRRPQKLMWPADKAARVCVKAIHQRKREFTFTGHGRFGAWVGRHAPDVAHAIITRNAKQVASNTTTGD